MTDFMTVLGNLTLAASLAVLLVLAVLADTTNHIVALLERTTRDGASTNSYHILRLIPTKAGAIT